VAAAQKSLNYLTTGLEDKTEGQKWHRLTNRMLIDLNHRCMTRPAAEEAGQTRQGSAGRPLPRAPPGRTRTREPYI